jgi:hypothetical protein
MSSKGAKAQTSSQWIINEQADKQLFGIFKKFMGITLGLLIFLTAVMALANVPNFIFFHYHKSLDVLAVFIVLIPFYGGIHKLFATRLDIGRDLVEQGQWKQAVAALDPFAATGQRFLDNTGEAHYLLARAYLGVKEKEKAEAARQFVLKHRKGVWANELESGIPTDGPKK